MNGLQHEHRVGVVSVVVVAVLETQPQHGALDRHEPETNLRLI